MSNLRPGVLLQGVEDRGLVLPVRARNAQPRRSRARSDRRQPEAGAPGPTHPWHCLRQMVCITPRAALSSRCGILSTLELRTCFELPATYGWAAQLYLHPTTDRPGSPAAPPSTVTGDPLITAAAMMSLLAGGVAPACICSVAALSVTARQRSGRPHPSQSEPNFPLLLVFSRLSSKRTFLCEPFEHAGDVHGEKPVC